MDERVVHPTIFDVTVVKPGIWASPTLRGTVKRTDLGIAVEDEAGLVVFPSELLRDGCLLRQDYVVLSPAKPDGQDRPQKTPAPPTPDAGPAEAVATPPGPGNEDAEPGPLLASNPAEGMNGEREGRLDGPRPKRTRKPPPRKSPTPTRTPARVKPKR